MAKATLPAKPRSVDDAISKAARQYSRLSPVEAIKWASEKEHIKTLIARSRDLKKAIPETILQAILQGASMGLSFNPSLGHCYLIPRRSRRRRQGESEADYERDSFIIASAAPSYKGLSKIVTDGNERVIQIRAEVVFEADKFKYKGPIERPVHEPITTSTHRTVNQARGVYAIAEFENGSISVEYVDAATVQVIRDMSDMPNSTMYTSLWTEGWKKIAIRRLCKTIPVAGERMIHAIDAMDRETGVSFSADSVIEPGEDIEDAEIVEDPGVITADQATQITDLIAEADLPAAKFCKAYGVATVAELPAHLYESALARIETYKEKATS